MNKLLIDAAHTEETRIAVVNKSGRLEEFEFESSSKRPLKGNIYLAKVVRVEPALQAAFVEYHDGRNGFLPLSEIHTDYYQLPVADKKELQKILDEIEAQKNKENEEELLPDESIDEDALYVGDNDGDDDDYIPDNIINVDFSEDDSGEDIELEGTIDDGEDADDDKEFSSKMLIEAAEKDGQSVIIENEEGEEVINIDTGDEIEIETSGGEEGEKEVLEQVIEEEKNQIKSQFEFFKKYKIQEVIKKNQVLLVQVVKEERGNKGAALTTFLSLAGRYCVLMPNTRSSGGVSRKITNQKDRKRLKKALQSLDIPEKMSLIVRTAGQHKTKLEIKRDYEYLSKLWEEIRQKTLTSNAPCLIHEEANIIKRAIRDIYDKEMDEILIEGKEGYKMAKDFMKKLIPSHAKKIKQYKPESGISLFHKFNIDRQIINLQDQEVPLPSGGSLVINLTEALVAIDVNSGKAIKGHSIEETAFKTNMEAAAEVARQMRLRDLAGLVVIDFIDMEDGSHIQSVEKKLRESVKIDRARIQIGSISQFGLLELSRQRLKSSYFETIFNTCNRCGGTGFVKSTEAIALNIIREIQDVAMDKRQYSSSGKIQVTLSNEAALYLFNNKRHQIREIENNFDVEIIFASDPNADVNFYKIVMLDTKDQASSKKQGKGKSFNKDRKAGKNSEKREEKSKNKSKRSRNRQEKKKNVAVKDNNENNKDRENKAENNEASNNKKKKNQKFHKRNKRKADKEKGNKDNKKQQEQTEHAEDNIESIKSNNTDNAKNTDAAQESKDAKPQRKKRGWWQNLLKSE